MKENGTVMESQLVALVTGSGRARVGRYVIEGLAADGYAVAVHYNRSRTDADETVAKLSAAGGKALAVQADVADERDVDSMIDAVLHQFGRLDVLVTTASIWTPKPLEETTAEDVRRQFEVNTLGTFLCARRAGLAMADQPEGGSIITVGDWAISRPYAGYSAYFVSKGSIPTLTRALAVELAQRNPNVRVNCIHPGPILFPDDMSEEEREELVHATLVKKANCPEDFVNAVRFFVQNSFVTGVCLPLDGGRSIYAAEERG